MTSDFGDRHHGNLDGKLLLPAGSGQVRITAGGAFASTQGGQHLLWMLINLLARQYGVVVALEIAVPAVALCPSTALFGKGANLQSTLMDTATLVAAGRMEIRTAPQTNDRNCVSVECLGIPNSVWAATADGWDLCVGPGDIPEVLPTNPLSIGPYFAASLVAAEVFKTIRGYDPSRRFMRPVIMSLWTFETYEDPTRIPKAPAEIAGIPLPYLVGAGAVGQALAATFITSHAGPSQIIPIDGDAIDEELTNLNRYCLSIASNRGRNKAELVSEFFAGAGVESFHFPFVWADYIQAGRHESLPSRVRAAERAGRFEHIISCVDKNTSRHDLQRMWPMLMVGASTLGMSAAVQIYDLGKDQECLMCANPLEADGWTLEGELMRLQQLSDAERHTEALRVGVDPILLAAHLRDPRCGTLGEAELRRFKPSDSRHDWSVGFVSVGAGVMLAAVLLRYFSQTPTADEPHAFRFSFETNRAGKHRHRPNPECECQQRGRGHWGKLWR
jgi:hypothetical protein